MKNRSASLKIFLFIMLLISCSRVNAQVGIYTEAPTSALDINGNMKVRQIDMSTTTQNTNLVVDETGVIKRSILAESFFYGFLASDFKSGTDSGIYKIEGFNEIEESNNDFDRTNSYFKPSVSGLYNIVITTTIAATSNVSTNNTVLGLVDQETGKWVMRFSIPRSYIENIGLNNTSGITNSFSGAVNLTAGKSYYFGVTFETLVIANPDEATDSTLGSYFSVSLIRAN